jgi:PST family polysaccharide transporter
MTEPTTPPVSLLEPNELPAHPELEGRMSIDPGISLRHHAARGAIVNAAFLVSVSLLGLIKGFVVAGFLTRSDYGIWGIVVVTLATLAWLKQVGIDDKYIQQSERNQELAFQKAFTLELIFSAAFLLLVLVAVPLTAVVYGRSELIAPGLVLAAIVPAASLQSPIWIHYRRMDFMRQRTLQAFEPVVGFVVTVGLAAAGAGYWSLVVGVVAGSWAAATAALVNSPYRIALRYDRGTARRYLQFSGPLLIASLGSLVIAQSSTLVGNDALGLAGVGAIALAASISQFGQRVDDIVTSTLYPVICAVRNRTDLLFESFAKSNRLALMWGVPFGVGLTLFASDLVSYGIGEHWRPAVIVLQVFGLATAVNQIAFNWDAYFRARADTRPVAVVSVLAAVTFLATTIPLTYLHGLTGFAIGTAAMTAASCIGRWVYVSRLFTGFRIARHTLRAIAPAALAAGAVLAARALDGHRTLGLALGEVALFAVATFAATLLVERELLREVAGYLRRVGPEVPGPQGDATVTP